MAGSNYIKPKLLAVALVASVIGLLSLRFGTSSVGDIQTWQRVLALSVSGFCFFLAVLSAWMTTMRLSYGYTLMSFYVHLLIIAAFWVSRRLKRKIIENQWKDPRKRQEDFLKEILQRNRNTAYAKEYGLTTVTSLKELKEKHTLTDYERYRPYIDRMAKGEQGLMTPDPLMRFALSSGTTGKAKMLPYTKYHFNKLYSFLISMMVDTTIKNFGMSNGCLQREVNLYTAPTLRYTEAGTIMGPASLIPPWMKPLLVMYSSPGAAFQIRDPVDSIYVHLLFALRDRNLRSFTASFTSNLMSAMRQLEESWPDIVRDIEQGTVSTKNISADIHGDLVRELGGGDPDRSSELRTEFEKGFDGIMKRAWPFLERVQAIDSTGIKDVLANSYVKGITLYGQVLGATEGMFGYNIWPKAPGRDEFVLMPTVAVLEFIPENNMHEDQPETFFIDELKVGGVYELVVTQMFGIYRFRYGDVIRVTRYHEGTPVVEFMYRSGQILNVHSEKMDQRTIQGAMESAVRRWPGAELHNYAVAESSLLDQLVKPGADHRPFYIIFVELEQTQRKVSLDKSHLAKIDEELCQKSFTYNSYREKGSIAPPVVHVVESGTFDRLHDFILDHSTTTANQYKVPRKLRTTETLKLMIDSSIIGSSDINANI